MTLSTFAYIIGTLMLLISVPLIFSTAKATALFKKVVNDDSLLAVLGAVYVVIAVLVLKGDMSIGTDAAGLLKLLAWSMGIKGVVIVWSPNTFKPMQQKFYANKGMMSIIGIVGLVIAVLCFYGAGLV